MSAPGLLEFLKRWWLLLILGPAVAGVAGYVFVGQVPSVYQANTTLLVSRGNVSATGTDDPSGSESLARTYAEALKTRPVLEGAAQRIGLPSAGRDLQQAVTVRTITGTQLLRLAVEDRSPARAADLANAIVAVFSEQNLELQAGRYASSRQNLEQLVTSLRGEIDSRSVELQQLRSTLPAGDPQLARVESEFAQLQSAYGESVRTFEGLRVAEARGLNSLTVVEPAVASTDPVRPSKPQTIALAVLAGLVVAAATAKLLEYLDDGLPTRARLAAATGLRTLGLIPRWRAENYGLLPVTAGNPRDPNALRAVAGYRVLFSTLMIASAETGDDGQPNAVLVTSAAMDEGKSLTAANLAAAFAESGRRVILVDADVHRPSQMRRFALPNQAGLSTLLVSQHVALNSVLRETTIPGLRVLTSGPAPAAPSALYSSRRLESRLAELRGECDVVVFDTPPVLAQPDAALLAQHVNGVVLVVDARKSRARQVRRALELLNETGVRVWGAALNRVSPRAMDYIEYQTFASAGDAPTEESAASSKSIRAVRSDAS